jgi:hypothetical protein
MNASAHSNVPFSLFLGLSFTGVSVKLAPSTGNLLSHKRPLVLRLNFFMPNDMPKKYSSRRPSKLTMNGMLSRRILPVCPKERSQPSCSIVKARRTPRHCLLRSSKKERIRLPSMLCLYPKSVASQKTRCSRSCGLGRARRSRGNAWSPRPPSSGKDSLESLSKWNAS